MWILQYLILSVSLVVVSVSSANNSDIEVNNLLGIGSNDETFLSLLEFYNAKTNKWQALTTTEINIADYGVAIYKGQLLLIGGYHHSNGNLSNQVNEVDLLSGRIETVNYLNQPRKNPSVVVVGEGRSSTLYIMGGKLQSGAVTATVEKWDESTQKWIHVSDMPAPCEGAAVVIHNDDIYIIGGFNGDRYVATVQVYNVTTQLWTVKRPMNEARGHFHGVSDGRYIYVVGGFSNYSNSDSALNRVDQYDPESDVWTSIADINYCSGTVGVNLLHDNLYAVGGTYCSRTQIYHKSNNTWQYFSSLANDRTSLSVVKVPFDLKDYEFNWTPGNRSMKDILVLGISSLQSDREMELYHPEDDSWKLTEQVEMTNTSDYRAAFVNDRLIICGGKNSDGTYSDKVFEISIDTSKLTTLSTMNEIRYEASFVTVGEGKFARLYAVGGASDGRTRIKTVERWNPFVDTWEYVSPMNIARDNLAIVHHEGIIYAFGGRNESYLNVTEIYLIDEDRWEFRAPMIQETYRCSAVSDGKYIYVVGGYGGIYLNQVQRYDISTDSWKLLANTSSYYVMGISLLNNAPTVFGGYTGAAYKNDVEIYDAENNEWRALAPMYNNRSIVAALQVPWKWKYSKLF